MFEQLPIDGASPAPLAEAASPDAPVVPEGTIGWPTGAWFDWVLTWCSMADAVELWPAGEILDRLDVMAPDDECAVVLRRFEVELLTYAERVRVLRLWERHSSWVAAQQQRWMVAIAGPVQDDDDLWVDEELGGVLHVSGASAAKRLAVARDLLRRFPRTLSLLEDGEITVWHAKALADKTRALDGEAATFVESAVLPRASSQTVGQFQTAVDKAVLAADMDAAEARAARANAGRRIVFRNLPDGQVELWGILPTAQAITIRRSMELTADQMKLDSPGDGRTVEQRQADALAVMCTNALLDPALRKERGAPVALGVTGDLATVLGLADNPGHLDGYGAIPASVVRELAGNATWRAMLLDAVDGRLISLSSKTYRPSAKLARFLIARDRTCRFVGCNRPAVRCDIDHRIPYNHDDPARGGQTDSCNCQLLCERHHIVKHGSEWRVELTPDGLVWTSPAGLTYSVTSPDQRPLDPSGRDGVRVVDHSPDPRPLHERLGRPAPPPLDVDAEPPF